jgi:GTPase SAR1 family protein
MSNQVSSCKLILLGNGSVGKTSIIQRFSDDGFRKVYKQTVGVDFLEKSLEVQGRAVKLALWDIGGQSLSSANLPNYVMKSDVVFLAYDVTDIQSFQDLRDWLMMVRRAYKDKNDRERKAAEEAGKRRFKEEPLPKIYAVGNKIDLIQFRKVREAEHDQLVQVRQRCRRPARVTP